MVPRDIEAAWRARSMELQALHGGGRSKASIDPPERGDELLLYHLKRLSSARAHASAMERSNVEAARVAVPVQSAQHPIDAAISSAKHQFDLRSPRETVRERAQVIAAARFASSTSGGAEPVQTGEPRLRADPVTPAESPTLRLAAIDEARDEAPAHRPAPLRTASAVAPMAMVDAVKDASLDSMFHDRREERLVDESALCTPSDTPSDTPEKHAFGSLTKRVSSTKSKAGQRTYTSWLSKAGSVRKTITKSLGEGAADSLVLTGGARMSGKVTSLSMISQGLVQQRKLVLALKLQDCFRGANSVHLAMISTVAQTRFHSRYGVLYREGASAYSFYVLVRGALEHTSYDGMTRVVRVAAGEPMVCFGTEGVTGGMPRETTVTCLESSEILHFATFRMRLSKEGAEEYARKAFATFVEAEMQKMPLFFGIRASTSFELSAMFALRECAAAGTILFRPGEHADALFILAKGRIVLEDADGIEIAKMQAGSVEDSYPFFGEKSLLEGGPRTTLAITRTPCKLLVMSKCHFARVNKLMPHLKQRLNEFYELRQSRAELARLAAADRKQRQAMEQRAKLRDVTKSSGASLALDEDSAATCVQKCWRGAHARGS